MPFGPPVRRDGVQNTERASGCSLWLSVINAFCRSSLYSNSLAAILLPIDVYTRGGWHLFGCMRELDGWGKPVRNETEASSKLSNGKPPVSTGLEEALVTPFAAGCPLPQVRINLSDLANCLLLLRLRRESFG